MYIFTTWNDHLQNYLGTYSEVDHYKRYLNCSPVKDIHDPVLLIQSSSQQILLRAFIIVFGCHKFGCIYPYYLILFFNQPFIFISLLILLLIKKEIYFLSIWFSFLDYPFVSTTLCLYSLISPDYIHSKKSISLKTFDHAGHVCFQTF